MRTISSAKVQTWVTAINEAGLRPMEGWCCPHRFGSFAPIRGLTVDGSQAQWFVDGEAAFEAIASSIQDAKSEVHVFHCLTIVYLRCFGVAVQFSMIRNVELAADLHNRLVAVPRAIPEEAF